MELLGRDNSEFSDVSFCPIPESLDFHFCILEPCLEVQILSYHLLHYAENNNSEFFQANQSL